MRERAKDIKNEEACVSYSSMEYLWLSSSISVLQSFSHVIVFNLKLNLAQ